VLLQQIVGRRLDDRVPTVILIEGTVARFDADEAATAWRP
jgi:hypothetical protein